MGPPATALSFDAQGNPIGQSAAPQKPMSFDAQGNPIAAIPKASAPAAQPQMEQPFPNNGGKDGAAEGLYKMISPDGRLAQIPYSKIQTVAAQGYRFANNGELTTYSRDYNADPVSEDMLHHFMNQLPWWDPMKISTNVLLGTGAGATKTAAGLDRIVRGNGPVSRPEEVLQEAAARPTEGAAQGVGEGAENVGEFFTGEELLGLVGKGLVGAERLKAATQLAQVLDNHPVLAALVKIGKNAVKMGTMSGAQTFVKTGGDQDAAERAGLEGAGGSALLEGVAAPAVKAIAGKMTPEAETAARGSADYAAEARGAAEPHLNAVSDAIENARGNGAASGSAQPGSALAKTGALVPRNALEKVGETLTGAAHPALDVDKVLNQIHDFTGAADRLAAVNDAGYSALDTITGGKFRALNSEVAAAQKASYKGVEGASALYQNKLAEMDALIDSTKGKVTPETVQALKASWRQSYQLRDFGNIWDRNLNGVPGSSNVSAEQRGVDGKGLMKGLQQAVRNYGRPQIEQSLGPGRLDNLENIARLNQTNAQRATFNRTLHGVAQYLPIWVGARIGEHVAGLPGEVAGGVLGASAKPAIERVLNAVKANPKIGQYLTYAVEYGANPKVYGPTLAAMIQKNESEAHEQQQVEQSREGDQQ